jgi:signal transduction histidine kinase
LQINYCLLHKMEKCTHCFAVHCDFDGNVSQVIHDADVILPSDITGSMLFRVVVSGDLDKYLNFFLELTTIGCANGWEITILTKSGPEMFTFFSEVFEDRIGIAAATTKIGAQLLFEELVRINNEQTSLNRSIAKENDKLQNVNHETGVSYYEELSRLNNELVNMQRELAKKNRELDALNNLKNQFLGIAAHDLRSPIGVILSYSEFLLENGATMDEAEKQQIIERMHGVGTFMFNLVNDLLDVLNIESGKLELNLTEEDLSSLFRNVLSMNAIFARSKMMTMDFNAPVNPVIALIDKPKIEQVLTNYLTNAMKFSYPGSQIKINMEMSGDQVRISVHDQGQGIREEELNNLFKPFEKTSTRSTAGERSTGLGLLIVKKIVEAHQGSVGVNSKFGIGSEFFFTLPVQIHSEVF